MARKKGTTKGQHTGGLNPRHYPVPAPTEPPPEIDSSQERKEAKERLRSWAKLRKGEFSCLTC